MNQVYFIFSLKNLTEFLWLPVVIMFVIGCTVFSVIKLPLFVYILKVTIYIISLCRQSCLILASQAPFCLLITKTILILYNVVCYSCRVHDGWPRLWCVAGKFSGKHVLTFSPHSFLWRPSLLGLVVSLLSHY